MKRKHACVCILYPFNFSCGLSFKSSSTTSPSMSPLGFLLRLIKIRMNANAERTGVFLVLYGVERWLKCLMTGTFYGIRAPAHRQFAGSESHIKHSSLMAEFISGWRQQTSLASVCSSPHNNPQRVGFSFSLDAEMKYFHWGEETWREWSQVKYAHI